MVEVKNDFSNMARGVNPAKPKWLLWLAVLACHGLALMGLDAALTVNRLAAQEPSVLEAAIVTERAQEPVKPKPVAPKPPVAQTLEPPPVPAAPEPVLPASVVPEPVTPPALAMPPTVPASAPQANPLPTPVLASQPARVPSSVDLRYQLLKGNDSAKASLVWRITPSADGASSYEATLEATYFGFSAFKQTSSGIVQTGAGLLPTKYTDKRRGKPEQAAHFERDKKTIIFSNNRPEAALTLGAQDRVSMFVQLASRFAAEPNHYAAGQTLAMPVANVDELENWVFEVQTKEMLQLPIGEREAVKLIRRPRRAFDQLVEIWLSPSEQWLPVRIRLTDSSGVTDQLLISSDKL